MAAVLALVTMVVTVGVVTIARHRAAAAADLAALAAATSAAAGHATACGKAAWVTDRMGATLRSCRLRGADAAVVVALRPPGPAGVFGSATGRARAGPAPRGGRPRAAVGSAR